MKKIILVYVTLFLSLSIAKAEVFHYEILQEYSISDIGNDINHFMDLASPNDTIIVTGSKINVTQTLELRFSKEVYIIWQATFQSNAAFDNHAYPFLLGISEKGIFEIAGGTLSSVSAHTLRVNNGVRLIVSGNTKIHASGKIFPYDYEAVAIYVGYMGGEIVEIKEDAQISSLGNSAILLNGDNQTITISGGSITSKNGSALTISGRGSKAIVSGGYLSNKATNQQFSTIKAYVDYEGSIHISGNAVVEAKELASAIVSEGSVYVSGNAKVSAQNRYAISSNLNVTVSGNSIIEAKNNTIAIYCKWSDVEINDQAQVIAANNYAVSYEDYHYPPVLNGGLLFAYGKNISDVIDYPYFIEPTFSGVVLAWDKAAGNLQYTKFSTKDIFKAPPTATAYWDEKNGKFGISYANNNNTGFIPIDAISLSVSEYSFSKPIVFPNPTTGVIYISSEQADEWTSIEIFDVYGRKLYSYPRSLVHSSTTSIDISHLPSGIYFVRVNNETVKVVKQ